MICRTTMRTTARRPRARTVLRARQPALAVCWLLLGICAAPRATTYLVLPDGTGDYPTIGAAVFHATDGDTVLLGNGLFTGDGNRDIRYWGKSIIVRSLSGDPDSCVIDCQGSAAEPHRGFIFDYGEGPEAALEGVTITHGYGEEIPWYANVGGGVLTLYDVTPRIENCVVRDSEAEFGGGIGCAVDARPTIRGCRLIGNRALYGGGAAFQDCSDPALFDCVLEDNESAHAGGGLSAGPANGTVVLQGCEFLDNRSGGHGGGAVLIALYAQVEGCRFDGNQAAESGGGAYVSQGTSIYVGTSTFQSNSAGERGGGVCVQFTDYFRAEECVFTGNRAQTRGGGLSLYYPMSVEVRGATFYGNEAPSGSGLDADRSVSLDLSRSIVVEGVQGAAIGLRDGSVVSLSCCDLYRNAGGDWVGSYRTQLGVDGNISEDPLFCDGTAGDFTLHEGSPCAAATEPNPECLRLGARPVACPSSIVLPDGTGDYPTLQAAADALEPGDVILLTSGVYQGPGNRDVDLRGKALRIVALVPEDEPCVLDCEAQARGLSLVSGEGPETLLRGLTVANGSADRGGAILCAGSAPRLEFCTLHHGAATLSGGAVQGENGATIAMRRCTLADNDAPAGAGVALESDSELAAVHSVVAFNRTGEAVACDAGSAASLSCCDVYGNEGGDWTGCLAGQGGAEGNIQLDPGFCGPSDYRLHDHSPCLPFSYPNPECATIGAWGEGCQVSGPFVVLPDGTGDFPTIQAAVDFALDGETILLGDGVFRGAGNRGVTVEGKRLTLRSQSGDPLACIIDCEEFDRGFYVTGGQGPPVLIAGLTVRNGQRSAGSSGAGVACVQGAWVRLEQCILRDNRASGYGGAVFCSDDSRIELLACDLLDNYSREAGGAASVTYDSAVEMEDCRIEGNETQGGGGGLQVRQSSYQLVDCSFAGNAAGARGGGLNINSSGAGTMTDCVIVGNEAADQGGGLMLRSTSPTLTDCMILRNAGGTHGGGLLCEASGQVLLRRCTLAENEAMVRGGGLDCTSIADAVLENCTLAHNAAPQGSGIGGYGASATITATHTMIVFGLEGAAVSCEGGATASMACTDIYGNEGGDWTGGIAGQQFSDGNASEDPIFCSSAPDDYSVWDESPCAPFRPPNVECDLIGAWPAGCSGPIVRPDGSGDYPTIQAAVDAVPEGTTVLLAAGTFLGEGNRDVRFGGKALSLLGARDGSGVSILDCRGEGRGLIFDGGEGPETCVRGITIRNGQAPAGGGVLCDNASPTLSSCTLVNCAAELSGGALHCRGEADPALDKCTLAGNRAPSGSGVACAEGARPHLHRCLIAFGIAGEAVACEAGSPPALTCCDLFGNEGGDWVGGIEELLGLEGNISEDPLFCRNLTPGTEWMVASQSPCGPHGAGDCGQYGAWPSGCRWTIRVNPEGTGDQPTIQAAIDAALEGDRIELADGVYTGEGNRAIDFRGKAIEVRSAGGDPAACIIDPQQRSHAFQFGHHEDSTSVLAGVTLRNGSAGQGGAVQVHGGAKPRLRHCVLADNSAQSGGAIYIWLGRPLLESCIFEGNQASIGGALVADLTSRPRLRYCTFTSNSANAGGAMALRGETQLAAEHCTFSDNVSPQGTGVHAAGDVRLTMSHTILAFGAQGSAVATVGEPSLSVACSDIYGNEGGDWTGPLATLLGVAGNFSADPLFCGDANPEAPFTVDIASPCAESQETECGMIGAWGIGCGSAPRSAAAAGRRAGEQDVPAELRLYPVRPASGARDHVLTVRFDLPRSGRATLEVFDVTGRMVARPHDGWRAVGRHHVVCAGPATWSGWGGIYYLRLTAGGHAVSRPMLVLR